MRLRKAMSPEAIFADRHRRRRHLQQRVPDRRHQQHGGGPRPRLRAHRLQPARRRPCASSRCRPRPTMPASATPWARWSTSAPPAAPTSCTAKSHYVLRHSAFDAPNFFNNKNGHQLGRLSGQSSRADRSAARRVVPRLYNGQNRTFWFYVFEDNRFGVPRQNTSTVPTAAERVGDFSALLRIPGGSAYQIYDPFTTAPGAPAAASAGSRSPNNIIPQKPARPAGPEPGRSLSPAEPAGHGGRAQQLLPLEQGHPEDLPAHAAPGPRLQREPPRLPARSTTTSGRKTRTRASAPASRASSRTAPTAASRWTT